MGHLFFKVIYLKQKKIISIDPHNSGRLIKWYILHRGYLLLPC